MDDAAFEAIRAKIEEDIITGRRVMRFDPSNTVHCAFMARYLMGSHWRSTTTALLDEVRGLLTRSNGNFAVVYQLFYQSKAWDEMDNE